MRVELHPEVTGELRSAALWYEERRPGFGDRLVDRVNDAFSRLGATPAAYPRWPGTEQAAAPIRRAAIDQFPYFVAFEVHEDHVLVLTVAHGKRRPLYWLTRATRGPA